MCHNIHFLIRGKTNVTVMREQLRISLLVLNRETVEMGGCIKVLVRLHSEQVKLSLAVATRPQGGNEWINTLNQE